MSTPTNPSASPIGNIVVSTDFSVVSETALLFALGVARRNHAKVWIVHVVGDTFFTKETQQRVVDDAWREGHRQLTDHFIAGRLDGVENHLLVEQGSVTEVLIRLVEQHQAQLLVIGTSGRSRIGKLFLGSTAESIFRQAPCPVLTVGPRIVATEVPAEGPRKILFCTGFSKHSLEAGVMAVRLAEWQNAELVLLHVGPDPLTGLRDDYIHNAERRLTSIVPADANLAAPVTTMVRFGTASEQILQVANEVNPDLIVLGVRQPEGFGRRLRWATAYDVVSNAPCPVLTVRTHDDH
ncbi:MAG: universal stress protein [Terriglobales bacterium]